MTHFLGFSRKMYWIYLAWIFAPVIIFLLFDTLGLERIASSGMSMESMGDAVMFLLILLVFIIPIVSISLLGWLLSDFFRMQKKIGFFWPLIVGLCLQSILLGVFLVLLDFDSDLFRITSVWAFLVERLISYLRNPILYLPLAVLQVVYFSSMMVLSCIRGMSLARMHLFSTAILLIFSFFSWSLIPGVITLY